MRLLLTALALIIAINSATARCRRPRINPVMGALQNIYSPANAERTMQMLQTANNYNPLPPIQYPPPIVLPQSNSPCNPIQISPVSVQPIQTPVEYQMPNPVYQMPVQLPSPQIQLASPPMQLPSPQIQLSSPPVQLSSPPVQFANPPVQFASPPVQCASPPVQCASPPVQCASPPVQLTTPPVQLASPPVPNPVVQLPQPLPVPIAPIQEVTLERPCPCEREIVYLSTDLPNYFFESSPPVRPDLAPVALTPAQDTYTCPLPSPASLFSFPAASPCSSCGRETTATRSQYLRKIPIPPPTL